jgi:hypothetical protein
MPTIPNVQLELWQLDFCSLARSCVIIVLPSLPIVFSPRSLLDMNLTTPRSFRAAAAAARHELLRLDYPMHTGL